MRRLFVIGFSVIAAVGAAASQRQEPPMAGIHWARGEAHVSSSPDLIYHGGPVMTAGAHVEPIFWGTTWTAADAKVSGMQTFYSGMSGSSYEATNTEYTDAGGAHVGTLLALGATHIDTSAAARNGNQTGPILDEVCRVIPAPVADGYYPVYTDTPRGHARFCAWHSAGTCNGVTVQFAFFFNLDGDPGCDPQDTVTGHPQGVAALGNVSGHELSEALTDQHLNAWFDANGAENADKCAWSFGTPFLTFSNRSQWKIQGNWSNRAFDGNTGYPNSNGQNGCIDGGNFK